jgi:outer membrane protein assembly factor BamA
MRIAIGFLFLSFLGIAAQAQVPTEPSDVPLKIRGLTVVSNDISSVLEQDIVNTYQGQTCSLEELTSRIRKGLRDMGYANARVEIPARAMVSVLSPGQSVEVTVLVSAGVIYNLSEIRFERTSVFPVDVLRKQFTLADGDIFKVTGITDGLEKLKGLYTSQGYINFGASPRVQYDETQHTIALTVELDEDARYYFGRLTFDGIEPNQGAFKKLFDTWNSIEGKPYDYRILENWLTANRTFLPGAEVAPEKTAEKYVTAHISEENRRIDIELRMPEKK